MSEYTDGLVKELLVDIKNNESARESIARYTNALTGKCWTTGGEPDTDPADQCPICRAHRTERAEKAYSDREAAIQAANEAASASLDEQGKLEARNAALDAIIKNLNQVVNTQAKKLDDLSTEVSRLSGAYAIADKQRDINQQTLKETQAALATTNEALLNTRMAYLKLLKGVTDLATSAE